MYRACPVCAHTEVEELIEIAEMPIYCNVLELSRSKALNIQRGAIHLVFCSHCGHIYNRSFNPELMNYNVSYENSLHYSGTFQTYTQDLAQRLVNNHQLYKKNIIEIGCGKGDFLQEICQFGDNKGFGFDKSYDHHRSGTTETENIHFFQDFYGANHARIPLDFLCCRHVLEHIQFPQQFLEEISQISPDFINSTAYFEVPNGLFTLRDFGIWDIIYEHCSYFTPSSLEYLFRNCQFDILSLEESFSAQYLSLDVKPTSKLIGAGQKSAEHDTMDTLLPMAQRFFACYQTYYLSWHTQLTEIANSGKRAVIWGCGSKGVTFLNIFRSIDLFDYAIDINPHKLHRFVPGTGQEVVSPDFLRQYKPDVVLAMNGTYRDEIANTLSELQLDTELITV